MRYVAGMTVRRGQAVVRERLPKSDLPAVAAVVPDCPRCGNSMVWRASWCCDACPARISWNEYSGLDSCVVLDAEGVPWQAQRGLTHRSPEEIPSGEAKRTPIFSSSEGDNCVSPRASWKNWLEGVELYTSPWRRRRAARHRIKAGSAWHRDREKGQAERFNRIAQCGSVRWVLRRHDSRGTTERNLEYRCDCWRVCQRCLARRRYRLTSGIASQRKVAFQVHGRQRARWYKGAEGRWSERLMTFTVPHGESPAQDARVLTRAWREMSAKLRSHLRVDRGAGKDCKPVWVRALEVAPGQAGGHAHLHVWWLGPFVDHAWLRVTWGRILEGMGVACPAVAFEDAARKAVDARFVKWARTRRGTNGREPKTVPWPVVDVRAGTDEGASAYAQKVGVVLYVAKGDKGSIERLHPLHAALVYQALESARCVQWARGWAPKREPMEGVTWSRRRLTDEERAAENERFREFDERDLRRIDASLKSASIDECERARVVDERR